MMPGADAPRRNQRNRLLRVLWLTLVKYSSIDGQQRAASFAYYAFFALFPCCCSGRHWLVFLRPGRVGTGFEAVSRSCSWGTDKHDIVQADHSGRDQIPARGRFIRRPGVDLELVAILPSRSCVASTAHGEPTSTHGGACLAEHVHGRDL